MQRRRIPLIEKLSRRPCGEQRAILLLLARGAVRTVRDDPRMIPLCEAVIFSWTVMAYCRDSLHDTALEDIIDYGMELDDVHRLMKESTALAAACDRIEEWIRQQLATDPRGEITEDLVPPRRSGLWHSQELIIQRRVPLIDMLSEWPRGRQRAFLLLLARGAVRTVRDDPGMIRLCEDVIFDPDVMVYCRESLDDAPLDDIIGYGAELTDVYRLVNKPNALVSACDTIEERIRWQVVAGPREMDQGEPDSGS